MTKKNIGIGLLILASLYFYTANASTSEFQETPLQKSISRGKVVYADFCVQCHLTTGKGSEVIYPPLDNSDWLKNDRTKSIHALKYGLTGEITVNSKKYNGAMPSMGLTNEEIADVLNYISNSWSNKNSKRITKTAVNLVQQ